MQAWAVQSLRNLGSVCAGERMVAGRVVGILLQYKGGDPQTVKCCTAVKSTAHNCLGSSQVEEARETFLCDSNGKAKVKGWKHQEADCGSISGEITQHARV